MVRRLWPRAIVSVMSLFVVFLVKFLGVFESDEERLQPICKVGVSGRDVRIPYCLKYPYA